METQIQLAVEQDYPEIEQIMKQVHELHTQLRPDIYKQVDTVLPKNKFLEHIKNDEILVAKKDDKVVGLLIYITIIVTGGPMVERKVLFVDSMAVDKDYRRKGIGHQLFDYLMSIYKNQNYDGLELQVNARNQAAKKMYEKYGFTEKSINMELL